MLVTTSLSKPLIGSINLNQLAIQRPGERVAKAQAAKQQAESTQKAEAKRRKEAESQAAKRQAESIQEADKRRESPRPRQPNAKLSQPRNQM